MENTGLFEKDDVKIIDTIEYKGKYTNVSTFRNKIISVSAVLFGVAAFICAQVFLL